MSERLGTELILQMIFAVRCTAADILLRLLLLKAASSIEEKKYQSRVTNGVHSLVTFDWCYYHEKSSNKSWKSMGAIKLKKFSGFQFVRAAEIGMKSREVKEIN